MQTNGIQPIIIFIPTKWHIGLEKEKLGPADNFEIALAKAAEQLALPLIDLTPTFKEYTRIGRFLYEEDDHWNSFARSIAATDLADMLHSLTIRPH